MAATGIRARRRAGLLTAVLALGLLAAAPLHAAPFPPEDAQAIRAVIEGQLAAFRKDDGAAAFAYASPTIRGIFRTPERFMDMVRSGYPHVFRPRRYLFLELREEQGRPVQQVLFVGPSGQTVIALYLMERQPDGGWRIDGVLLKTPQTVSA